jgi:hypothetical protein
MIKQRRISWPKKIDFKNRLKNKGYDLQKFKDMLCYHKSNEKTAKVKMYVVPQIIFGLDSNESYPNLFYFDNSNILATMSRSNPWVLDVKTGIQKIYFEHTGFIVAIC